MKLRRLRCISWLIPSAVFTVGSFGFAQSSNPDCSQAVRDPHAPQYNVGRSSHSQSETARLLLQISVQPQVFRPEFMTALARQLNQDFCKEPRIRAIIVDDFRAATFQWDPVHLPEFYAPAERGQYYLDRTTGEERLEFSTKRGRGVDGFIDLDRNAKSDVSRTYKGVYRNNNFGYSASIPLSLKGVVEVPPTLEGGILITLSADFEHYIWLGASHNTARYNSLAWATNAHLEWLKNEGAKVLTFTRRPARLGSLRAERLIIKYKSPGSDATRVQDLVLAIKFEKDEVGIVYQIEMRTTQSTYAKDIEAFNQIVRSWRPTAKT